MPEEANLSPVELYDIASDFLDQESYDKALKSVRKAIEMDSTYTDAYYLRGLCFYYQESYPLAIADFHKVIELDPEGSDSYMNIGMSYSNDGNYDY